MVNCMAEIETQGWNVQNPINEIADKPDNSNIFCYPNFIMEYLQSGNEEGAPPIPLGHWYVEKSS
jgi:hypothetical protein